MRIQLADGRTMHVADITEPLAISPHECAWKGCEIHPGKKYVRVVFRIKGEGFECKHYCPSCWTEMNQD